MTNQNLQNNQNMNAFIAMLQERGNNAQAQLTNEQKQQLAGAYKRLYFGLSATMWTRDKTLGNAWQTAMDQTGAYISGQKSNNIVTQQLNAIHAEHRAKWSRVIMTSQNRDAKLPKSPELTEKLQKFGAKNINNALNAINQMIGQYDRDGQNTATKDPTKQPKPERAPIKSAVGNQNNHPEKMAVNAKPRTPTTAFRPVKNPVPGRTSNEHNQRKFDVARQRMQAMMIMQMMRNNNTHAA